MYVYTHVHVYLYVCIYLLSTCTLPVKISNVGLQFDVCVNVYVCVCMFGNQYVHAHIGTHVFIRNTATPVTPPQHLTLQHSSNTPHQPVTPYNMLLHTTTSCQTLQHTATRYSMLQNTATPCNTFQQPVTPCNILRHTATQYNTTSWNHYNAATRCNTISPELPVIDWHPAAHCNTLHHTVSRPAGLEPPAVD